MADYEELNALAVRVGAHFDPGQGWVLPFYLAGGEKVMLPIEDWLERRKAAAEIYGERATRPIVTGLEPTEEEKRDLTERIKHQEAVAAAREFEQERRAARSGEDRRYGERRIEHRRADNGFHRDYRKDLPEDHPYFNLPEDVGVKSEGMIGEPFDMAKPEPVKWSGDVEADNWQHRGNTMRCRTCMFYVPKKQTFVQSVDCPQIGRCRQDAPTLKGWPAVYPDDWCGAHKIDADKL
jgi:hypothetical protein